MSTVLEDRIVRAAEEVLAAQQYVGFVDVLNRLGWLPVPRIDEWRQGRIDSLEATLQVNPSKIVTALALFRRWAQGHGRSRPRRSTSPAPGTAGRCAAASAGIPESSGRTARTGRRPSCLTPSAVSSLIARAASRTSS
ncbi:MAG: hypothetical protein ACR2FQ_05255 [Pseudonocardiaceae bacterium]